MGTRAASDVTGLNWNSSDLWARMNNLAISRSHPLNRSIAFTAKMLALVTSMLAFTADNNNLMKLRGGMSLGPITPGNWSTLSRAPSRAHSLS